MTELFQELLVEEADEELGWQERALCAQTDPESFFPEKGGSTREAKKVCLACEVRSECLEYALANDERFGIWGGLSEREQPAPEKGRGLRRPRRLPADADGAARHTSRYRAEQTVRLPHLPRRRRTVVFPAVSVGRCPAASGGTPPPDPPPDASGRTPRPEGQ